MSIVQASVGVVIISLKRGAQHGGCARQSFSLGKEGII
jgi:hypothetical protein